MAITTICSTKGGVGKTTLTANLGALLADEGFRVLLVDADVQPTLSSYYPVAERSPAGLYALMTGPPEEAARQCVSRTALQGLDLVVSDDPTGALPSFILHTPDGRFRLRRALHALAREYDQVLVDTQGAVSPLLDAAVVAADALVSPIPPEVLSAREFARGTVAVLERVHGLADFGVPTPRLHAVLWRMDRTVDARRVAKALSEAGWADGDRVGLLRTVVPAAVAWREAASARAPIHRLRPRSPGRDAASQALRALAAELAERGALAGAVPHREGAEARP